MSIKKIKQHNSQQFLDDLKSVRDVMVKVHSTDTYLHVTKREVLKEAENRKINYVLTDGAFRNRRTVMVII